MNLLNTQEIAKIMGISLSSAKNIKIESILKNRKRFYSKRNIMKYFAQNETMNGKKNKMKYSQQRKRMMTYFNMSEEDYTNQIAIFKDVLTPDLSFYDQMCVDHLLRENESGKQITRTLADFLSKKYSARIKVVLSANGHKKYFWKRDETIPLRDDEHFNEFVQMMEAIAYKKEVPHDD
jgi:hypothetical protein